MIVERRVATDFTKIIKILIVSAVVTCCTLVITHFLPSHAVTESIDISTLTEDRSGTGWSYDLATNTITLTADDITLTGSKTRAPRPLSISGNYALTLDDFEYTTALTSYAAPYALQLLTDLSINLVGTNHVAIDQFVTYYSSPLFVVNSPANHLNFTGEGSLLIDFDSGLVDNTYQNGIKAESVTINGGKIDVNLPDRANSRTGIEIADLTINDGSLTVIGGSVGINASTSFSLGGGSILATNLNSGYWPSIHVGSVPSFDLPSAGYAWEVSTSADGSNVIKGTFPDEALPKISSSSYHYVKIVALSRIIDVATDLEADNFGIGWSYKKATNTITLTDDDVVLTGTKSGATRGLSIAGQYRLILDELHYSTGHDNIIRLSDNATLHLVNSNSITNTKVADYSVIEGIYATGSCNETTPNPLLIEGTGSLDINLTGASGMQSNALSSSCGLTVNGGTINISVAGHNKTMSAGSYGVISASSASIKINDGSVNVKVGNSPKSAVGLKSGKIEIYGGVIESTTGSARTSHAIEIAEPIISDGYVWSASPNESGTPLSTGRQPFGEAFAIDGAFQYVKIDHDLFVNTPPTLSITSPAANSWHKDLTELTLTGTFTDPDDHTSWSLRATIVDEATPPSSPSSWISCPATSTRTFSCSLSDFPYMIHDGPQYLFIGVDDGYGWVNSYVKVYVDNTRPSNPVISISVGNLFDNYYTNSPSVEFTITPGMDAGSGVKKTTYKNFFDDGEIEYTAPFTITEEGGTRIDAFTYDAVGNKSQDVFTVLIDRTNPEITSSVKSGAQKVDNIYLDSPTIELVAVDPQNSSNATWGSGIRAIAYDWLPGTVSAENCTFSVSSNNAAIETTAPAVIGTHTLCYMTTDNAGNTAESVSTYIITNPSLVTLTDSPTGITVENLDPIGFLPDQYLKITKLPSVENDLSSTGKDFLVGYTIEICSDFDSPCDPITSWPKKLRIKIPIDTFLSSHENLSLIYLPSSDSFEIHPSTVEGNYLVFDTDHLSDWAVLGSKIPQNVPNTGFGLFGKDGATEIGLITLLAASALFTTCVVLTRKAKH